MQVGSRCHVYSSMFLIDSCLCSRCKQRGPSCHKLMVLFLVTLSCITFPSRNSGGYTIPSICATPRRWLTFCHPFRLSHRKRNKRYPAEYPLITMISNYQHRPGKQTVNIRLILWSSFISYHDDFLRTNNRNCRQKRDIICRQIATIYKQNATKT